MKFHTITIQNLNSLYGEHAIDVDAQLGAADLFLILGPTGAGKSTILDAICLALFGQTPRLPRSSGSAASQADQYAHNVMSYGTGECRAELVFSKLTADGTREKYRATWYCRRSRSQPGGNIQTPVRGLHRVHDDGTEDELADSSQKKYYEPQFEDVLQGMTVDDFMRCIMLAQGQFTAFLRASESEKASILERLTRTDEYKNIGQRAAARRQEIARELKDLESQLEGLEILPADALASLELERGERTEAVTRVTASRDAAQAAASYLERLDELTRRAAEAQSSLDAALAEVTADADLLERVATHRKVAHAAGPLLHARAARAACWDAHAERAEVADALTLARPSFDEATATHAAAQAALTASRDALDARRDAIERALSLDASIAERAERLTRLSADLEQARARLTDATTARDDASATLITCDGQAERARADLDALAGEAELIEDADAIESQIASIEQGEARLLDLSTRRDAAASQADTLASELSARRDALAPQRAALDELEAALELARSRAESALGDADSAAALRRSVSERAEAIDVKLDALEKAQRSHEDLLENAKVLEDAEDLEHAQADAIGALEEERDARRDELAGFEKKRFAEHAKRDMLREMLAYSDARQSLEPGEPCPVCGSTEHPGHAAGGDTALRAQLERVDEALERLDARERDTREAAVALEKSLATAQRTRESAVATQRDAQARRTRLVTHYDGHRHRAGLDAIDAFPAAPSAREALRAQEVQARATLKLERQRLRDTLDELGAAREALNAAQRAHSTARSELDRALAQLELGDERLSRHAAEASTLGERVDELHASLDADRRALHAKLTERGVPAGDADAPDLRGALEHLRADRERLTRAREALTTATAAQDAARAAVESARAELRSASERVSALETSHAALTEELESTRAERADALDHDDPRALREQLEGAVTTHAAAAEAARAEAARLESDIARLEARLEERHTAAASRDASLAQAEAELTAALAHVELDDESSLDDMLLPEEGRDALLARADAITSATESARADLERLGAQRDELASSPPEVDGLEDRDLEAWRAQRVHAEAELAEHHAELGKIEQTLERHRKACEDSRELASQLTDLRATYGTWKTIANLIGTNDGDAFKTFAQSLNLQELVDRANVRLAKLSPRYTLAVARGEQNEPRLDFVVRDRHQANAERPLTTLSGGETFLVSLALALGLSDLHRVDLPIETLMLDEGFGTLDQETLDAAMTTLRHLQHDVSRQIGIISHVEGLKERVPARIHVDKLGNGRSSLRIEIDGIEQ